MKINRITVACTLLVVGVAALAANHPFRATPGWGDIGRAWGSTSAVYTTSEGNVWVAERCGENTCVGHDDLDNVFLFNPAGELLKSFGAGVFVWPHGLHVDPDGNVWVTDARGEGNRGHQVHKFDADGELLMSLGKEDESPFDGTILEYVNPVTGGPSLPTMDSFLQRLKPGQKTQSHRHSASAVYLAVEGYGQTMINGTAYAWAPGDVFALPLWASHYHENLSASEDAVLFSFTDAPVMKALHWYREQEL